jgi:hypothetical protein
MKAWMTVLIAFGLGGCTTSFIEFEGACVMQQWALASVVVRRRQLCDLPAPEVLTEGYLRDREAMDVNPFPNLFDLDNKADTVDRNLLEKTMDVPPDEGDEE